VYIYIDHVAGEPLDPKVKEFLTYVLSSEGQQAVTAEGDYLPLSPSVAAEQRRKLE
jgi:phosphate transport system substrate-binding protein